MIYKVIFTKEAEKSFAKLQKNDQVRIIFKINELANGSNFLDIKKLIDEENIYRLRVGNYRILYEKINDILEIHIIKVGHRKDIYK